MDFLACTSQSLLLGNFKEDTHNFGGLYKQEGLKKHFQPHFQSFIDWLVQQLGKKTRGGLESRGNKLLNEISLILPACLYQILQATD